MTLTKGSFTYSSGEEYRGEWKEGEQGPRAAFFTDLHPSLQDAAPHRTCPLFQGLMKEWEMSSVFPLWIDSALIQSVVLCVFNTVSCLMWGEQMNSFGCKLVFRIHCTDFFAMSLQKLRKIWK